MAVGAKEATTPLQDLIFDWNHEDSEPPRVTFDDETLRDGLQNASVRNPPLQDKIKLLHLMAAVGITSADLGLPGSSARAAADVEALCREIETSALPIEPNCAARTTEEDIVPVLEIMYRLGRPVEIMLFVGSSPIRFFVEGWSIDDVLRRAERAVKMAVTHGARVTFVTEDTTRSHPDTLRRLVEVAVRAGAARVCIADTSGYVTPVGVRQIVAFVREVISASGGGVVGLDWHGHNDRGLATANALCAARAGADRLHATVLGVGERVGNPPMEQILVNAKLLGWADCDLTGLVEYVTFASEILDIEIPRRAPVVGHDAFRTSTGVHAAAILKASAKGDVALADMVYSAVPAAWVGQVQALEVGPMSGVSNVRHWLAAHGYEETPERLRRVLDAAKGADRTLTDEELDALVRG